MPAAAPASAGALPAGTSPLPPVPAPAEAVEPAAPGETDAPPAAAEAAAAPLPTTPPPPRPAPTLRSPDGRFELTDKTLTVEGETYSLLELERAEVQPVRWLLWYLLGGLGLAAAVIAFLQNWLRTAPAMLGMALSALLFLYGQRGANRLRLHRLGRTAANFALPGEPSGWQRLVGELNRRIRRAHDQAAAEAAALLAQAEDPNDWDY